MVYKAMLISFVLLNLIYLVEASVLIMPLDQIKPGMKGSGRSVFLKDKIEEFDVEILGILRDYNPKSDLILAKLSSPIIDRTGISEGMSGSPVYIEGKLIGAVAYGFSFAKEAVAGITPIEEMLKVAAKEEVRSSKSSSNKIPYQDRLSLEDLFEINKNVFKRNSKFVFDGRNLSQMSLPLVFSGFSSRGFDYAADVFSKMGFNPVQSGGSLQSFEEITASDLSISPGDPIGVQLISGDINMSAIGTVTYVDENKVLAFGHPLYGLGSVEYSMVKAQVITVVPNLSSSFKISTTGAQIGAFFQDRPSGMYGKIGNFPNMIPVNIKMLNSAGDIKEFKLSVVDDKILTPFLVNVSASNVIAAEERALGDLSLEFSGDIYLENGMNVHLEDLFSGNFDASIVEISNLLTAVVFYLVNNEFMDLGIHKIDLLVRAEAEPKFTYLEKVWLDKYDASPGEQIQIELYTRNFRGETVAQKGAFITPHLPSGSEFYVVVADSESMRQLEASQYRTQTFFPRSLSQLLRILNNQRKNNRIYVKVIASKPGLFLKGEEMPNLPETMKSMFASPRSATSSPTELDKSTLMYYQLPVPYVFRGLAVIPVKIN
ncbi:MAG: hypothetical protein JW755_12175 [Candidatus Aminicenantes bacterium]|nr:hypothetical protein [Candidatus Aminicenantes bacterium]